MNKQPWECCLETCGQKRMANFMKALVLTGSHFTSSFTTSRWTGQSWHSIYFMVHVPEGKEEEFEKISGCKLKKIMRICVGMDTMPGFPYKGNFANKPGWPY